MDARQRMSETPQPEAELRVSSPSRATVTRVLLRHPLVCDRDAGDGTQAAVTRCSTSTVTTVTGGLLVCIRHRDRPRPSP
eukprot:414957-Rhodomonas_salina.2